MSDIDADRLAEILSADANREGAIPVRYVFSPGLVSLLDSLQSTLIVTTYQASRIVLFRAKPGGGVSALLRTFDQPMGLSADAQRMVVATRTQIISLRNAPDIAVQLDPPGTHDACYLPRIAYFTGDIRSHEVGWTRRRHSEESADDGESDAGELCIVNTRFSCLCTVNEEFSFVETWRPPFITDLKPDDRCHLNGVAFRDGVAVYVTALGQSDEPHGWRDNKAMGGVIMDVTSGEVVGRELCMPHSPRLYVDRLWVLNSGRGELCTLDVDSGTIEVVAVLPGYLRGLTFAGRYALVGLSKIRDTSTFGGVPLADRREELKCGVAMVDLRTGDWEVIIEFQQGVTEVFDVQIVDGIRYPAVFGTDHELIDGVFVSPEFG